MAETWYEVEDYIGPRICQRLVSSETACFVFHPNERKSQKTSVRGLDWHKTFEDAKEELIRRGTLRLTQAKARLKYVEEQLTEIQAMTEESCSKNS